MIAGGYGSHNGGLYGSAIAAEDGSVARRGVPICGLSRNACLLSPVLAQDIGYWTSQLETGSRRSWPRGLWARAVLSWLLTLPTDCSLIWVRQPVAKASRMCIHS